jgi:hypothetical protein
MNHIGLALALLVAYRMDHNIGVIFLDASQANLLNMSRLAFHDLP